MLDDAVIECEIAQSATDAVKGHQFVGELLQVHAIGEVFERNRGRPDIAQALQGIEGPALALFCEGVSQIERAAGVAHSESAEQHSVDCHLHQLGDDVDRQLDGFDELTAGFKAARIDQLHQQAHEVKVFDSRGLDVCGLGRNAMQKGIEHTLLDGADGHQIFAHTTAARDRTVKRLGHICRADQVRLDQQISQPHS